MSDKLQFVAVFGQGVVAETDDKLKFVGHSLERQLYMMPRMVGQALRNR